MGVRLDIASIHEERKNKLFVNRKCELSVASRKRRGICDWEKIEKITQLLVRLLNAHHVEWGVRTALTTTITILAVPIKMSRLSNILDLFVIAKIRMASKAVRCV